MPRRRVHDASALFQCHVFAQNPRHNRIQKWMLKFQRRKVFPGTRPRTLHRFNPVTA